MNSNLFIGMRCVDSKWNGERFTYSATRDRINALGFYTSLMCMNCIILRVCKQKAIINKIQLFPEEIKISLFSFCIEKSGK